MPKFNYAAAAGAGPSLKARRALDKALDKALDDVLDDACDALSGVFESAVQTALEGARDADPDAMDAIDDQDAYGHVASRLKAALRKHLNDRL